MERPTAGACPDFRVRCMPTVRVTANAVLPVISLRVPRVSALKICFSLSVLGVLRVEAFEFLRGLGAYAVRFDALAADTDTS